jgi:hypothetical protein
MELVRTLAARWNDATLFDQPLADIDERRGPAGTGTRAVSIAYWA